MEKIKGNSQGKNPYSSCKKDNYAFLVVKTITKY